MNISKSFKKVHFRNFPISGYLGITRSDEMVNFLMSKLNLSLKRLRLMWTVFEHSICTT